MVYIIYGIIGFAIFCFSIFFLYKQLQFVLQAINLYKNMIERQDETIKVLNDIRNNTSTIAEVK